METKFVLASLQPLIIQLLYPHKFFVISCLCIQRVGNNKIFYFPMTPRKHLLLLRRDLICTKKTLATEYLPQTQINRKIFLFSFHSNLNSVFLDSSSALIFGLPGICSLDNHSVLLIAQFQIDFVILSQSIDLQLPILLMQWTDVVLSESIFI